MTIIDCIQQAYIAFLGEVAGRLVDKLNVQHKCAQVRLGEDGHGLWGLGVLNKTEGGYSVRVWQQSAYLGAGNLNLIASFESDHTILKVTNDNATWIERSFQSDATAEHIAGWIADSWDAAYCVALGVSPLPENKYTQYTV